MYSVVLMVALSGAGDAPALGGKLFGGGCCGASYSGCCGGVAYSSCSGSSYGSCYGSCYGSSYSGCCGYSCSGSSCSGGKFMGGLFKGHHKSCHGSSCCGYVYSSGCCGGSYYGGSCYGSSYSGGCCGMSAPSGMMYAPGMSPSGLATPEAEKLKVKPEEKKPEPKKTGMTSSKATIVVNLPAEAVLTVDGQKTSTTSAVRVFTSPELEQNRDYYYDMKAEFKRDGKSVEVSKRIIIRAGSETPVDLNEATVATVKN